MRGQFLVRLLVLVGIFVFFTLSSFAQVALNETIVPSTNRVMRGELTLRAGGGRIEYSEDVSNASVDSDFESGYGEFGVGYSYAAASALTLQIQATGWVSDEDLETWRSSGKLFQRNSLEVKGVDLLGRCGLDLHRARPELLTLWLGLGYRAQTFERDQFRFFNDPADNESNLGSVQEDYRIALAHIGVDGAVYANQKLSLRGSVGVGFVFFSEADNDLLGTINGDGGTSVEAGIEVSYAWTARQHVGLEVHYSIQELDGDNENRLFFSDGDVVQANVEWPDNEFERFALDVFWRVQL